MTGAARLVVAGHGSADPRFAETAEAVATRVRALRPGLEVAVAYLEHGPPLEAALTPGCVVVPLLLSSGFHVRVDIPAQAPGATVSRAVGPDPRLSAALVDRLAEAGYDRTSPVVLAAAGSADERSLDDVRVAAGLLSDALGAPVETAFVSAGAPRLADLAPAVVASYLLAPGAFYDAVLRCGARVVGAPIGDHPAVAEVVLERYDEAAQVPGRTAPA